MTTQDVVAASKHEHTGVVHGAEAEESLLPIRNVVLECLLVAAEDVSRTDPGHAGLASPTAFSAVWSHAVLRVTIRRVRL